MLTFLVAIPFVVPHQSLPEVIIVFTSVFILITALIAGTAGSYLFLTRPTQHGDVPVSTPAGAPDGSTASAQELEHLVLRLLEGDEQVVVQTLLASRGFMFQRDLVKATGFSDAKVSRLLDRLEDRRLLVREREGMTNRIRLTLRG